MELGTLHPFGFDVRFDDFSKFVAAQNRTVTWICRCDGVLQELLQRFSVGGHIRTAEMVEQFSRVYRVCAKQGAVSFIPRGPRPPLA